MIPKAYRCLKCNIEYSVNQDKAIGYKCEKCGGDCAFINGLGAREGNVQSYFCQELGLLNKKQQDEYKKSHPDAVFNSKGAMLIRGLRHQDRVLAEKNMVCLTDSKEYRDYTKEQIELARQGHFDRKK